MTEILEPPYSLPYIYHYLGVRRRDKTSIESSGTSPAVILTDTDAATEDDGPTGSFQVVAANGNTAMMVAIDSGAMYFSMRDLDGEMRWRLKDGTGLNTRMTLTAAGILTATGFSGPITGTATEATNVTVVANNSTDETVYPTFVDGATGTQGIETDTGLTYNPSTGLLQAAAFKGPLTGNVTGNASGSSGSCTGNAATATALETARTIGGVSFNGTGNINLPGVNTAGNQDTSGTAADATVLETARTINGVSFNGSANITVTAAAGTLSGSTLASGVTASSLTSVGTLASLSVVSGASGDDAYSAHFGRFDDEGLFFHSDAQASHYNWRITTQTEIDTGFEIAASTATGGTTWADPLFVIKQGGTIGLGTTAPVLTGTTLGRVSGNANEGGQLNFEGGTSYSNNFSIDRYQNELRLLYNGSVYGKWDSAGLLTATDLVASGSYPIKFGHGNTKTVQSIAIGTYALQVNTGTHNIAIGYDALNDNTSGIYNIAIGNYALDQIITGVSNVGIGYQSLSGIPGDGNVAIGHDAGKTINSSNNVAIGAYSLDIGNCGGHVVAVGAYAGRNVASGGSVNTFVGAYCGTAVTTGDHNVFMGYVAGYLTTSSVYNTYIGNYAGYTNVSGNYCTAVGYQAQFYSTNVENTSFGALAGHWITTGYSNTMIGYYAGAGWPTTGYNNTCLGYSAKPSASNANNEVTLGNTSISALRCQVALTALSDERDKTDIEDLGMGLDFICRLRPRRWSWNMRDGGKVGIEETGFVAQELQQAQTDEGSVIPNLVFDNNPDKLESSTATLIPALVKAIQELADKVEALT